MKRPKATAPAGSGTREPIDRGPGGVLGDRPRLGIEYIRISDLVRWDRNPKKHDEKLIRESIIRHGFRDAPIWDRTLGALVAGNGRSKVLMDMKAEGLAPPRGVVIEDGEWHVPVQFGIDASSIGQATAFAIDHNNLTLGGGFDVFEQARLWEEKDYIAVLKDLDPGDLPFTVGADDLQLLVDSQEDTEPGGHEEPKPTAAESRRPLVDVIFTFSGSNASCCMAYRSGLMYGLRSTDRGCDKHPTMFVDNEFKVYDHDLHLDVVAKLKPKYATVRDAMTRKQCKAAGIEYYSLDQILRWAEQIGEHAEKVIVIPKYDCLKDIPEKHVLGYSVPSSYGATPMPIEAFAGRPTHLLGGSPKRQYGYWLAIPDDVVSVDTNYISRVSMLGRLLDLPFLREHVNPEIVPSAGGSVRLMDLGFVSLPNPFYVAFAINVGYYLALFSQRPGQPIEDPDGPELPDDDDLDESAR